MKACSTVAALAGLGVRQLDQDQQPAGALDQSTYCAGIAGALDEVAFPVAGELAVLHLGRAHVNAEHVGHLAAPVLALAARHALVVGVAQAGDQVLAQFAHGLGIDAVVNGFVRHAKLMVLGVDARQCQGNLFGRPALSQQMLHDVKQDGVVMQFTHRAALSVAVLAGLLSRGAAVLAGRGVATKLSADGAGRTTENAGDLTHAVVLLPEAGEGHAVFGLEQAVGFGLLLHRLTLR